MFFWFFRDFRGSFHRLRRRQYGFLFSIHTNEFGATNDEPGEPLDAIS